MNLNDFAFPWTLLLNDATGSETASHAPRPDASSRSRSVTSHISHTCKLRPRSSCCQPVPRFLSGLSQVAGCTVWYEQRLRARAKLSCSDCHLIIWHLWRNIIPGDGCRFSQETFCLVTAGRAQDGGDNNNGSGGDDNNEDEFPPLKCLRESWPPYSWVGGGGENNGETLKAKHLHWALRLRSIHYSRSHPNVSPRRRDGWRLLKFK